VSPLPTRVGVLGVGALASAMVQALHRARPALQFYLSPRNAEASAQLAEQVDATVCASNQAVADACDWLLVGVRPAQLDTLAAELHLRPQHRLMALSAGTPLQGLAQQFAPASVVRLMTGLAVAGGASAISCYPADEAVQALWQGACGSVIAFDVEAHFEASTLAVCANAWWLDQLAVLSQWMVTTTGMREDQARALLACNMADVPQMLALYPAHTPAQLARFIGSPGTYTEQGLNHLQTQAAHVPWVQALEQLFARMNKAQ